MSTRTWQVVVVVVDPPEGVRGMLGLGLGGDREWEGRNRRSRAQVSVRSVCVRVIVPPERVCL